MDTASLQATARQALTCLDLTSLNDADTEADIAALCRRAQGPHGPVAAVCVWPRLAAFARAQLPASIAVAAVANFPAGGTDIDAAVRDTHAIVEAGAQEVDVVLPWRALMAGDVPKGEQLLRQVRRACPDQRLKVILESGELGTQELIAHASRLALDAGADFVKTSTGKTAHGATLAAARTMLSVIAADRASRAGFKASGGIRTVGDARPYIELAAELLGADAVTPARFRFGASGLLTDIEAVLGGGATGSAAGPSY